MGERVFLWKRASDSCSQILGSPFLNSITFPNFGNAVPDFREHMYVYLSSLSLKPGDGCVHDNDSIVGFFSIPVITESFSSFPWSRNKKLTSPFDHSTKKRDMFCQIANTLDIKLPTHVLDIHNLTRETCVCTTTVSLYFDTDNKDKRCHHWNNKIKCHSWHNNNNNNNSCYKTNIEATARQQWLDLPRSSRTDFLLTLRLFCCQYLLTLW